MQCTHDFEKEAIARVEIWPWHAVDEPDDGYFKHVILKWYPDDEDSYSSPEVC